MLPLSINPLPILLTLMTSFGVLMHDTQTDHAATTALAQPIAFSNFGAADAILKSNDPHIHTERINVQNGAIELHSAQPRTQTRDDKKYISVKKFVSDGMGSQYHWPSV